MKITDHDYYPLPTSLQELEQDERRLLERCELNSQSKEASASKPAHKAQV